MKHLTITYDDMTLYDADVAEFTLAQSDTEISVRGCTVAKPTLADTVRGALTAPRNGEKGRHPANINAELERKTRERGTE